MMLRSVNELQGCRIHASDGEIGTLAEFYFDDQHWVVRYLVVTLGDWLSERRVLIAPSAIVHTDWAAQNVRLNLTKAQVKDSPDVDTEKPVSRQQEAQILQYYNWPSYWGMTPAASGSYSLALSSYIASQANTPATEGHGNPYLRRTGEVIGYYIEASDGDIGHVEDFILDDDTWAVRYMIIDTRNWWPGKKVLIAPSWITKVQWSEKRVYVRMTREAVKQSPEYDAETTINREYEERLQQHYQQ